MVDPEVLAVRRARRAGSSGDGAEAVEEQGAAGLERRLEAAEERAAELARALERATAPPHEQELLRSVALLEQERQRDALLLEHGRAAVSAREGALRAAEEELVARAQELRTVRDEAEGHRAALRQAESALEAMGGRVAAADAEFGEERRRRLALEAEVTQERTRSAAERAEAEAATRAVLARGEAALRAGAEEAQRTLEGLRAAWASTANDLDSRVAAERARADAAEAAGRAARAELAERGHLSDQLRAALDQVRGELDAARHQHAEQHAAVAALVAELVAAANGVRAGFEAELTATQERVEALHNHLHASVAELREQLAGEEAARRAAEEALAVAGAEHADAEQRAAAEIGALSAELERLADPVADDPPPGAPPSGPPLPPADHPALRRPEPPAGSDEPPAVIVELTRAAARLRAAGQALNAPAAEPAPPEEAPAEPSAEPDPVAELGEDPGDRGDPEVGTVLEPEPEKVTEPGLLPALLAAAPPAGAWCAPALAALAGADVAAAERLLLAMLPVQGPRAAKDVAYELDLPTLGRHQVWVRAGDGVTVLRGAPRAGDELRFSVVGPVEALAGLVVGGAHRRLPGAAVSGRRWRLRRLLRELRAPVGIDELREAGARPQPGDLLALLCSGVPAETVSGSDFVIAYVVTDADGGPTRTLVRAEPDGALTAICGAPESEGADATVTTDLAGLLGLLAGTATARVRGDAEAAGRLQRWLLGVQGVAV